MNITEYDIFSFVYYQNELDSEKVRYITDNPDFKDILEYYNQMKLMQQENITLEEIKAISASISTYKSDKVLTLFLEEETEQIRDYRLAAKSTINKSDVNSFSFLNWEEELLVRINVKGNESTIFLFTPERLNSVLYKMTILPSNDVISEISSISPVVLKKVIQPQQIELIKL